MPRYVNVEGRRTKYWEIELDGTRFTTRHGLLLTGNVPEERGTATKDFKTAKEAKIAYEMAIFDQQDKGFQLVDKKKEAAEAAALLPKAPAKMPRNAKLEEAILAAPDAIEGYEVYGDWLQTVGDPRGELVGIQIGRTKATDDAALRTREAALLKKHAEKWLGELLTQLRDGRALALTWRYGFVDTLALGVGENCTDVDGVEAYTALAQVAATALLRDLTFGERSGVQTMLSPSPNFDRLLRTMAEKGVPKGLRRLAFDVGSYQISWTELGDLSVLYPQLRVLEDLYLHVGAMTLGEAIDLPALKTLRIVTGGFTKANMAAVTRSAWPNLTTLSLAFGDPNFGGDCTIEDVDPLLEGAPPPRLEVLGLTNAAFADDLPEAVARSPLLRQIRRLDLSQGTMSDIGGRVILSRAPLFAHLEHLDLSNNYLSDATCAALTATFGDKVVLVAQGEFDPDEDDDDRYVQISE